jgi:GntR family transcriptional regulator
MKLVIDPANGVPIYEQIVRQVKFAVAEGVLIAGELIPSTRELAREFTVNPNTVQRALQQLQAESIVESIRGRGMAVCAGARRQCVADRQQIAAEQMTASVVDALRSGLDEESVRKLFEKALVTSRKKVAD